MGRSPVVAATESRPPKDLGTWPAISNRNGGIDDPTVEPSVHVRRMAEASASSSRAGQRGRARARSGPPLGLVRNPSKDRVLVAETAVEVADADDPGQQAAVAGGHVVERLDDPS
jgi:hypothetical protein